MPGGSYPDVLAREIAWRRPERCFAAFAGEAGALLLDSAAAPEASPARDGSRPAGDQRTTGPPPERVADARFAYIALEPLHWLESRGSAVTLDGLRLAERDPFAVLARLLARYPRRAGSELPPFQGGMAGLLGYDLLHHLEGVPAPLDERRRGPDMAMGLYDLLLAFDLEARRCWVLSGGLPHSDSARAGRLARRRIERLVARLPRGLDSEAPEAGRERGDGPGGSVRADFTRTGYERAVARVVEHIHEGDIFQANLAQRFRVERAQWEEDYALYLRLRQASPAPFAAYLNARSFAIASASPERFLAVRGAAVEARPIKGTRPRGATAQRDRAEARALLGSEKDRAENVMIVDLLRNDLARVCRDASVRATQLCGLESFRGVHHLVSTVTGEMAAGYDAVDLLRATFPCGSITGAPRVRAMEIIHQLEPVRRGPYSGSIGWWGLDGAMDASVAIRTVVLARRGASVHAGGGIVADSEPAAEYDETLVKAAALIAAVQGLAVPEGTDAVEALSSWLEDEGNGRAFVGADVVTASAVPDDPASPGRPDGAGGRSTPSQSAPRTRAAWRRRGASGPGSVLLIDNYDSFVDSLARYVGELGWPRDVVRNDAITVDEIRRLAPSHIILSPGPDGPAEAGICVELVRRLAGRIPILGVCLGHQAIALSLGGAVVRARRPVHGRTSDIEHDGRGLFEGLPHPLRVTRYHSLVAAPDALPPELEVSARTEGGTIMALRHRRWPLVGLQFHPEAVQTVAGHRMLANLLGEPAKRASASERPRGAASGASSGATGRGR